jgi:mannitol-specific phosphotransferase system IIBC component
MIKKYIVSISLFIVAILLLIFHKPLLKWHIKKYKEIYKIKIKNDGFRFKFYNFLYYMASIAFLILSYLNIKKS